MNRDKVLRAVKGFRGRARNCIRLARNRYEKSLLHAFVGRKLKQRQFRALWITRINAATRLYQLPYGRFVSGLRAIDCQLNRKSLAQLAVTEPFSFRSIVDQVKHATSAATHSHSHSHSHSSTGALNGSSPTGQQQQQLVEQHYPSHGKVHTSLVVNVRGPAGGPATHRRAEADHTRAALEAHYEQQRAERAREAVQRVTVSEAAKQ